MLTWGLLLVTLCALPQCCHSSDKYSITAPAKVQAVRGSCVVIPCTFTFRVLRKIRSFTGLWKKESEAVLVAAKAQNANVQAGFRGRTRLLGEAAQKNCTWMLGGARKTDEGRYFFRLETSEARHKYSWVRQPTELEVVEAKRPALRVTREGALCFVAHMCPVYPPTFHWHRDEAAVDGTQWSLRVHELGWMTFSFLWLPPELNSTAVIRCTVTHYGGATAHSAARYP